MKNISFYYWDNDILILKIRVIPNSKNNAVGAVIDNAIQIRLKAAPIENKANKALIDFLAQALKIPKSHITIINGKKSKIKTLALKNAGPLPDAWK